tara:strand:+ start:56 stop:229 length:174 start_codon:yes stop_codon:yes gene_type:complete
MKKEDTTTRLQTKDWEYMTLRLPYDIKEKLREDANKHMRPIGMHLSFIVTEYFKEKK